MDDEAQSRDYKWRSSPTVADGKVYCMNHNGEVVVVDAKTGKALHHAFMGQRRTTTTSAHPSVVVAHGRLFIRTNDKLYCVGGSGGGEVGSTSDLTAGSTVLAASTVGAGG